MTSTRISVFDPQGRIIKSRKVYIMDSMADGEVLYVYNDDSSKMLTPEAVVANLIKYEEIAGRGPTDKIFGEIKWYKMNSDIYWRIQRFQEDREWQKTLKGLGIDG